MNHIESRPSRNNPGKEYDFYVNCSGCPQEKIDRLVELLKPMAMSLSVQRSKPAKDEGEHLQFFCLWDIVLAGCLHNAIAMIMV